MSHRCPAPKFIFLALNVLLSSRFIYLTQYFHWNKPSFHFTLNMSKWKLCFLYKLRLSLALASSVTASHQLVTQALDLGVMLDMPLTHPLHPLD
jgi:hypothetical protein